VEGWVVKWSQRTMVTFSNVGDRMSSCLYLVSHYMNHKQCEVDEQLLGPLMSPF
jgi:hypothetical protein